MVRAWLRLARWRLRRRRRLLADEPVALRPDGGPARRPWQRRPAAGWRLRALLWTVAAFGIGCPLLASGVACLAAARAHFAAPAPTLLLLDRQGRFLGELPGNPATTTAVSSPAAAAHRGSHRGRTAGEAGEEDGLGYWPVAELPPRVVAATLALEDRRFGAHPGVDPLAVGRAALQNLRTRGRVSGASTLAMQVARMQSPGARGYLRKVTEALTAVFLTERYGSREVLRQYLRIVPYGNRIHGIAYAARSYFDKPVEDLSWAEIAFLAALPQAPARMNPFLPAGRERAVRRGERVLAELAGRGVLSPAEYALAQGQLAGLRIPYRERRPPEALHALLHLQTLAAEGRLRGAGAAAPILRTTLDLDLQRDAAAMTWRALREWRSRGAGNASLIVLDLSRHEVLAWVGSAAYFDAEDHGAIDYARVRRSAGSTLKPFLYAQALERGVIGPTTLMDDLERGPGGVANADDAFMGPLLPRVALANSRNVPAVLLLGRIGLDQGFGLFRELGLTDGAVPARHYGLGMAIGGLPVTLEELARAYLALAGDGSLPARLRWLRDQPEPAPRRIFAEETARQVTLFLSDPQARLPSFPRMGATEYRFPVAVKTGTSTNYHDAWAVAYSTRYLAAAWVGHPGFRAMNQLSGYLSAADLVRHVLLRLHGDQGDGLEDLSFPPPRGYRPVRVCALSGHRATAACDRVFVEWFRPGEEPADDCEAHQQRAVDRRNGLLATQATPPAAVEVRTFVELPPRYAAWQAAAGLPRPPDAPSQLTLPAVARWGATAGDGAAPGRTADRFGDGAGGAGTGAATGFGAGGGAGPGTALPPGGRVVLAGGPTRLRITSPEGGARLLRDPETPAELNTVALRVVVDPPVNEVVWYVDGLPFATAAYPYTARWRLQPGEHTFQVRLGAGNSASRPVQVTVD
ncbi:MAG TPA: transglycosylase domain-containing protein [Thermoanaerobaculia bacterium]|nr:transglycosylase domain-containing protein [Thermoanaerobaculia bacterium]